MVFEKNDLKYCRSNYRLNISPLEVFKFRLF